MAFPPAPSETKSQIKKAGRLVFDLSASAGAKAAAVDLVDRFRAAHAYPINTLQSDLYKKLKHFPGSFKAQRLKRMPSIIKKLRREPTMQVTTMQDIGGLRAVVGNIKDVYALERMYSTSKRFPHQLKSAVDYISAPRNSGYRGLHLIYEYENKNHPSYSGLLLELQIRTKLQHSWATAVEIMELLTNQPLKSSLGSEDWLEFFALTGSAFALLEGKPVAPQHSHLTDGEIYKGVRDAERELNVRNAMENLPLIVQHVHSQPRASQYHLVVQNFDANTVTITSYSRVSLKQATEDYAKAERNAERGNMNVVLVSADDLPTAYPNLFLESNDFVRNLENVIGRARR